MKRTALSIIFLIAALVLVVRPGLAVELVVDNGAPGTSTVGAWCVSGAPGSYGPSSLYNCGGSSQDVYRWTPALATSGRYDVYLWWTTYPTRETDALFRITEQGGAVTLKTVDQKVNGGQWNHIGSYTFGPAGPFTGGYVEALGLNG
ncbi:MAG TPA: hypothetical protein VM778_12565, partial [Gemmatimonadota bacterium]|nr:hypothetical protein [Gemmatimonadota bacterium]